MICGYKIGTQLNRVTKYEGRESQFEGKFGTFCTPPPPPNPCSYPKSQVLRKLKISLFCLNGLDGTTIEESSFNQL